jgi:hypothetical protein
MLVKLGSHWIDPSNVRYIKCYEANSDWDVKQGTNGPRVVVAMKDANENIVMLGAQELADVYAERVNLELRRRESLDPS